MFRSLGMCFLFVAVALPISGVAQDRESQLRNAAKNGSGEEIRALLEEGIPVDAADNDGRTALMIAAEAGQMAAVTVLLEGGAALGIADRRGQTARNLALAKGRLEIVAALDNARERIDNAREQTASNAARAYVEKYREGITSQDDILMDFPKSQYADREVALLFSEKYTVGLVLSDVTEKSKTTPDRGFIRIGYYKGSGPVPTTYATDPSAFVVTSEFYFVAGILTPKNQVSPSPANPSALSETSRFFSRRVTTVGGKRFSIGGIENRTIRPIDAAGLTQPDLVRHEIVETTTPLFIRQ